MCKSKQEGGQRCYAHTSEKVAKARAKLAALPLTSPAYDIAETALRQEEVEHASTEKGRAELSTELLTDISNRRAQALKQIISDGAKLRTQRAAVNDRYKQLKADSETIRNYLKTGTETVPDAIELHDLPGGRVGAILSYDVDVAPIASWISAGGGGYGDEVAKKWFRTTHNADYTRRGSKARISYRITEPTDSIGKGIFHTVNSTDPNEAMTADGYALTLPQAMRNAASEKHPVLGVPVDTVVRHDPDFSLMGMTGGMEDDGLEFHVYVHEPTGTLLAGQSSERYTDEIQVKDLHQFDASDPDKFARYIEYADDDAEGDKVTSITRGAMTYLSLNEKAAAGAFGPQSRAVQKHLSKMAGASHTRASTTKKPNPSDEDGQDLHNTEVAVREALISAGRSDVLESVSGAYWDVLNRHPHQEAFGNYTQREFHVAALALAARDLVDPESDWNEKSYAFAAEVSTRNYLPLHDDDWNIF